MYLSALKFKSEIGEAYIYSKLSRLYLSIGKTEKAKKYADQLLKKYPNNADFYQLYSEIADFKKDIVGVVQKQLDQYGLEIYNANIEELKDSPPKLYRDAALPLDPLDQQSETRQIDFYCLRARKVASYLKEHPREIPYFHYRDGTNEDALLAFLVWYILDKQSCPWENLTAWLISDEIDQKQVLSDDTQIELFGKLVKRIDATAKNQVMTNWLKKAKK